MYRRTKIYQRAKVQLTGRLVVEGTPKTGKSTLLKQLQPIVMAFVDKFCERHGKNADIQVDFVEIDGTGYLKRESRV